MSFCKCGGYLGSGGSDMYGGRWCKCQTPEVQDSCDIVGTTFVVASPKPESDFPGIKEQLVDQVDALKAELIKCKNIMVKQEQEIRRLTAKLDEVYKKGLWDGLATTS